MILRENYFDFSVEISDLGYPGLKIRLRKYLSVHNLLTRLTCFDQELPKNIFRVNMGAIDYFEYSWKSTPVLLNTEI